MSAKCGAPVKPPAVDRAATAAESVSRAALSDTAVTGGCSVEEGGDVGLLMSCAGALR